MATLNPNVTFKGNCEQAFDFYQTIFGGELSPKMRWGDYKEPEMEVPDAAKHLIMHVSLLVGESTLMGGDALENSPYPTTFGNNFTINIGTKSKKEADNLFNGLSKDGNVMMPMDIAFWGDYFGMFTDQFGIQWQVICDAKLLK